MTFAGRTGAVMPRHAHLGSHAAMLVLAGDVELEVNGQVWRMMRGDFANLPPGTPHGWTMRSDRSKIALFTMNDRVGSAFVAMGTALAAPTLPRAGRSRQSPRAAWRSLLSTAISSCSPRLRAASGGARHQSRAALDARPLRPR